MRETYPTALAFVLQSEGGFNDDAGDSGGPTLHGITWGDLADYRRIPRISIRSHRDQITLIKSMRPGEQADIYKTRYWDRIEGDQLAYPIDMITFDAAVNLGVGVAITLLDEAVQLPPHLAPDPILLQRIKDKVTKGKLKQVELDELTDRITRYRAIVGRHPEDAKFLHGWLNRVAALKAKVGA